MITDARIEDKLRRQRAFWTREEIDRPAVTFWMGTYSPFEVYRGAASLGEGLLTPERIHPEEFLPDYERLYQASTRIDDDSFYAASPFFGIPWLEGMVGCPVYVGGESVWSEEYVDDLTRLPALDLSPENPWLVKLLEFTGALVEHSAGRYAVALTLMRGPGDLLGALRGVANMALDLYDHPDLVEEVCGRLADFWLAVARAQLALIPPFHGGGMAMHYRLWAPGPCVMYQEDAFSFWSPPFYIKLLRHHDERVIGSFENTLIHLHSPDLWSVPYLLEIEGLRAIEINCDLNGPPVRELLPVLQSVQRAGRSLVVRSMFTEADLDLLLEHLSPRGLLINILVEDEEQARQLARAAGLY